MPGVPALRAPPLARQRQRRLSPDEVAPLVAEYKAGADMVQLAERWTPDHGPGSTAASGVAAQATWCPDDCVAEAAACTARAGHAGCSASATAATLKRSGRTLIHGAQEAVGALMLCRRVRVRIASPLLGLTSSNVEQCPLDQLGSWIRPDPCADHDALLRWLPAHRTNRRPDFWFTRRCSEQFGSQPHAAAP